jgi:hypothetical protein
MLTSSVEGPDSSVTDCFVFILQWS